MTYVAEGADARIGVCIGRRSDKYRVGQPGVDPIVVTPPAAAPTAATGAAGNVTSSGLKFRYTWVVGGLETSPGPASSAVTPAADQVDLTDLANCADSRCTEKRIYGSEDDFVTEFWAGSVYDNSTTTYTFDVALTSDALDWSLRAPSANETGLNHGMQFVNPQSVTLEADYTKAKTNEINGGQNHLAMVNVAGQMQSPLRNGLSIPMLIAAFGSPTVTRPAAGVVRLRWLASVAKALQRGVDFLVYYGAGHIPEFFWNVFIPDVGSTVLFFFELLEKRQDHDRKSHIGRKDVAVTNLDAKFAISTVFWIFSDFNFHCLFSHHDRFVPIFDRSKIH